MNAQENQVIALARRAGRNAHFHVEPRYTPGSPALVNLGEAANIAANEMRFHVLSMTGVWGEENKRRAENLGLAGIVYARWEAKRRVWRLDLITGECFVEPQRLDWEEEDRVLELRNRKEFVGLNRELQAELDELERRARLHRQEVRRR